MKAQDSRPVQVRALELVTGALQRIGQATPAGDGLTPEARYAINRLRTRARHAEEREPKTKKRREKRKSEGEVWTDLREEADRLFSKFIRWRDTEPSGAGRGGHCITCTKWYDWADLQCGHWIRREHWGTRWHPRNCHAQCVHCNKWRGGREEDHAAAIEKLRKGDCDRLRVLAKVNAKQPDERALRAVIEEAKQNLAFLGHPEFTDAHVTPHTQGELTDEN